MIRSILFFSLFLLFAKNSNAAVVVKELYIVGDSLQVASGLKIPYLTFNEQNSFSSTNARIIIDSGDDLDLTVFNTDSVTHEFEIKGISTVYSIPAGNSVQFTSTFSNPGAFVFHDPLDYPNYASVGLGGMIVVKDHSFSSFYWNIKEHETTWNAQVVNGNYPNWNTYYPDFFTINGKSNPNINADPDARITGNVGDTIYLYMTNTGQSIHVMHLHGYHADVMYSSKHPQHVGRSKDSQGIYPGEAVVLRIVPDKPGEYPVHDHNLIATTGGNTYPLGMFTTILIAP